jgi:diguanylate cyclase (GGDEF)-like protein/PAS domain S-box-containing protein
MTLDRPFDVLVVRAAAEGLEEREWTWVRKDGKEITVLLSVTALRDEEGAITGFLHVATDVTERKAAEAMLRKQSAAITASMDGIGILDERLEFTYVNDSLAKLFGYPDVNMLLGRSLCDLYEPHEQVRLITSIVPVVNERGRWRGEATGLRRDGASFPQEVSLTAIGSGGMVCVVRDITERTYAEEQIKHLAYHDALTGLPNRLLFKDRLTVALSHAQRNGSRLAVLFLDLDRFKTVNDTYGYAAGDRLLVDVHHRLRSELRASDLVFRWGGEEFVVLAPHVNAAELPDFAERLRLLLATRPFSIDGRPRTITGSVGAVLLDDARPAQDALDAAGRLVKKAKQTRNAAVVEREGAAKTQRSQAASA